MNVFFHTGDLGDIVYSVATIRALGGGKLILGPSRANTWESMTEQRFNLIAPLLRAQSCIDKVEFGEYDSKLVTHNLNDFRATAFNFAFMQDKFGRMLNNAELFLHLYNLPLDVSRKPWLDVDKVVTDYPVLIHKSSRQLTNDDFPWQAILDKYGARATFVGTKGEWNMFTNRWKVQLPYLHTDTLLELARVIAGCDLFIGCQSCPFSIAEGFKKDAILEAHPNPKERYCDFKRDNLGYNTDLDIAKPL